MLQDLLISAAAAATAASPSASNAESLQQLGFSHMIQNQDFVSRAVLFFLVVMSIGAWWYTIVNLIKNALDSVHVIARRPEGIFAEGFRQIVLGARWDYEARPK